MERTVYIIMLCLSLAVLLLSLGAFICSVKKHRGTNKSVTPLWIMTFGVFMSVLLVHIPVNVFGAEYVGIHFSFWPILLSVYDALRAFILETDFEAVNRAVDPSLGIWRNVYLTYVVVLYCFAPVLTVGNVVSVFQNLRGEILVRFNRSKPMYVFSTLDEESLAMAESAKKHAENNGERAIIVFTDVFEAEDEENYENRLRAYKLGALCLKKDIANLDLHKKKARVQLFLMGTNESETLAQAIKLTDEYKECSNVSIYLFAATPSTGYIMDSICSGFKLDGKTRAKIKNSPEEFLDGSADLSHLYDFREKFFIKRFNSYNLVVQSLLTDEELCKEIDRRSADEKVISLLIVGFGSYGKQILKAAVWMFQEYGYKLEINVIDNGKRGTNSLLEQFTQQCPDLVRTPLMDKDGEANYDIRYFTDVDCFSAGFEDAFLSPDNSERLRRTQVAFVTLGDDEKNIRTAMELRKIFDRLGGKPEGDDPIIYSVVFDEKKSSNLNTGKDRNGLKNHKGQPYNIRFVGNLSSQFSYERIEDEIKTENEAFVHHLEWVRKARGLRSRYLSDPEFARLVKEDCKGPVRWGDSYLYPLKAEYKDADRAELRALDDTEYVDYSGSIDGDALVDMAENYMEFEYFRFSSIARSIHKKKMEKKYPCQKDWDIICDCKNCDIRRRTEHMRWNAYMRTLGFTYNEKRNDRAKLHNDLVCWDSLSLLEKYKD